MTNFLQNSILIVDDTPSNIRILFDILHGIGFKVSVVQSGELALQQVPLIQPDLILLDVMMPGIDGFETCSRLKLNESTREIPIIFMTALSDVENKVKGLKLGAVDYITKPIQLEEVLARVKVHLALRNMQVKLQNEVIQHSQAQAKLQQTLNELQQAQTQLIQAEKMSSLGQLVAGIAHEINNPLNFIYGNLSHAHAYTQDLLKIIEIYQQCYPKSVPEIEAEVEARDFNFITQDLPKVLESMQVGADRIREIVLSLRVFSRLDEAEMKEVDIHQGIDSTLMILGHRLTNKSYGDIEIIKKYGKLPLIECYAGQLNQVFMNIISNAIDAINEAIAHQKIFSPCITIHTELIDNQVTIRIADNGLGIPEEVKERIFDPFFSTKAIGIGIGMGLAISYQIVKDMHHGSLSCLSQLGKGTEFIIAISLKQKVA